MNHYPHHIGDFDKATRHLTRIERSIYRDLIELYYDTEAELTLDLPALCRKIIARSNEESTAVEQVLNEFFIKTATGWFHSRCDQEIENYRLNNSQKAAAGRASAAKKAAKRQQALNGNPTDVERTLNGRSTDEEQTNNGTPTNQNQNQEPITNTPQSPPEVDDANTAGGDSKPSDFVPSKASAICIALRSEGIGSANSSNPELLALIDKGADIETFVAAAKASKGASSSFPYVLKVVRGQLQRAADIAGSPGRITPQAEHETPYQRQARERVAEFAPGLAKKTPAVDPFTITEAGNVIALGSR